MPIVNLSGSDNLTARDRAVRGGTFNESGSDSLRAVDGGGRVKGLSGTDALAAIDLAVRVGVEVGSDRLLAVDSGVAVNTKVGSDQATFADLGSTAGSIRTLVASDLLTQTETALADSSRFSICVEPYVVTPALGTREDFVLTYPFVGPYATLSLRVPLFGNTDVSETGAKVRRTLNNQLSVARGASWPVVRTQRFSFSGLSRKQRDDFLAFAMLSAGYEIGILDQENRQWRGVVTALPETTQVSRACDFATEFQFRGGLA